jgi:putative ABC transport system permease protein
MNLRDLIDISVRNLWRIKLRTTLTTSGVIIAIATFAAMLSFAAGNHQYFTTAFNEFGLLNQMSVTPKRQNAVDTTTVAILDEAAIQDISKIPGVRLAYPYSAFSVKAAVMDTVVTTTARALPLSAIRTKLFSRILGGQEFTSEFAREAVVTQDFLNLVKIDADSLIGKRLILSMKVANMDSALAAVVDDPRQEAQRLFRNVDMDSVYDPGYQRRFAKRELNHRFHKFFEALMERQIFVSDTLTIAGVAPDDPSYRIQTSPIVIPAQTARRLSSSGFVIGDNPSDLFAAARDGSLFDPEGAYNSRSYPRVTLELEPLTNHKTVKDSIVALGYRAFSFAEQFENMQRFMVYYYVGLGIIGLIALATASLGIINTLVMSITERRREIGILKSLGAHESNIRMLFLVESSIIGAIGSTLGIILGWIGTRIVAAIMKTVMAREDMPIFDPFAMPLWLIALAFAFGVLVSLIAGLYPAARAARVDPVEALRNE